MRKTIKFFFTRVYTITSIVLFALSYGAIQAYAVYYPTDNITNPTCAPGDSGCYVSLLPSQTSNAGKLLVTDGTNPSWSSGLSWDGTNSNLIVNRALRLGSSIGNHSNTNQHALHIVGSADYVSTPQWEPFIFMETYGVTPLIRTLRGNGTPEAPTKAVAGNPIFRIQPNVYGDTGKAFGSNRYAMEILSDGVTAQNMPDLRHVFSTSSGGGNAAVYIYPQGLLVSNGVVAYTTTPTARLQVNGSGLTSSTYTAQFHNSTGANNALVIRDDGAIGAGIATNLSRFTIKAPADTTNIGGTTTVNASTTITGVGTTFTTTLGIGDRISLSSSPSTYATVTAIASDTSLTVNTALGNGTSQTINLKKSIFRLDDASGTTDMVMNDLGNVSIGNTTPLYTLHVGSNSVVGIVSRFQNSTGTCDINPTTTSLSCSSDRTLKTNITNLNNTILNQITSLQPVTYTWINDNTNQQQTGFIAQDVEQIFPSLVSTDPTTNLKSLNYIGLIPYAIEGIRELDIKVNQQASLFNNDQNRLDKIKVFFDNLFGQNKICVDDQTCLTKSDIIILVEMARNNQNNVIQNTSPQDITENVVEDTGGEIIVEEGVVDNSTE